MTMDIHLNKLHKLLRNNCNLITMNPLKDVNYFSLDLELNNKKDGTVPKIIQVGIAIGSPGNIFLKESRLIKIK